MEYFSTPAGERRINGYPVSELKPFLSDIQKQMVGLNAMMAMLAIANNIDSKIDWLKMSDNLRPGKHHHLKEITANVIMLRTVLRSIEAT